jgi:hypothetical protein
MKPKAMATMRGRLTWAAALLALPGMLALAACTDAGPQYRPLPANVARVPWTVDSSPSDPVPAPKVLIVLCVYRISVPLGTVSHSDAFWKRVDESAVNIGTYDLLLKNGVRVGEAPLSEWSYFKSILDASPITSQRMQFAAVDHLSQELEMTGRLDNQVIFYVRSDNEPVGRSFDHCQNLLSITAVPTPRQVHSVRLTVCPVVRSIVTILQYTPLDREQSITLERPERLYDVNLTADIPPDHFLILAPSSDAQNQTCLGNRFLVSDAPADKQETILLFVPQPSALPMPANSANAPILTQGKAGPAAP